MNRFKRRLMLFVVVMLCALSVSAVSADSVWEIQSSGFEMTDISLVSADYGMGVNYRCGSSTVDVFELNGDTWSKHSTVESSGSGCAVALQMVSRSDGWLMIDKQATDQTEVYRWNGSSWNLFTSFEHPNGGRVNAMDMVAPNNIWALADAGTQVQMFRWDGSKWITKIYGPGGVWADQDLDIYENVGFAVGIWGNIAQFDGVSWTPYTPQGQTDGPRLNAVAMTSTTDGFIVGEGGIIMRYQNGVWNEIASPISNDIMDLEMLSTTLGYAVGKGGEMLKFDGNSWLLLEDFTQAEFADIDLIDENNGWAIGDGLPVRLSGGATPPPAEEQPAPPPAPAGESNSGCVIPDSGPWPPCATGGDASMEQQPSGPSGCQIPASGPWPPCATGGVATDAWNRANNVTPNCVKPESGSWPACAK